MDLSGMSRPEKFKYLKTNGVKAKATMKTTELDRLLTELDAFQRGETETKPEGVKSLREGRKRVPLGTHRQKLSIDHLKRGSFILALSPSRLSFEVAPANHSHGHDLGSYHKL